ncbi:MAG: hypothetical protein ABSF26_25135 [Thermoguttaceae bacterium]
MTAAFLGTAGSLLLAVKLLPHTGNFPAIKPEEPIVRPQIAVYQPKTGEPQQQPLPPVPLAPGWQIEPTGNAQCQVIKPDRIRLDRGELLIESVSLAGSAKRPPLVVETPAGKATAIGTNFYIGTHPLESLVSNRSSMTSLTRVLVLAGVVTLVNAQGSVIGHPGNLERRR